MCHVQIYFHHMVDWIMRNANEKNRGIHWPFTSILEDLDYADDLLLISSRYSDIQEKTSRTYEVDWSHYQCNKYTGLTINATKTKTMRVNCRNSDVVIIDNIEVEDMESFIYLGATI